MDPASELPIAIDFGRFRVLPHRRELLAEGRPVELGGRAFDVLMARIEARGAVVRKNALMERVWPDRIVEENSLQAQISALRKAFGADRDLIRTIAGRGYQFTAELCAVSANSDAQALAGTAVLGAAAAHPPTNLPEAASELIGRDFEFEEVLGLTASHRLVTLTGARGIGKTRLGLEVARHLLARFADGVWVAELAPLSIPTLSRSPWPRRLVSRSREAWHHRNVSRPRSARNSSCSCSTIASMWSMRRHAWPRRCCARIRQRG